MTIPVTKNLILAFKSLTIAVLLAAAPITVRADVDGDFDAGMAAFRRGDLFSAMEPLRRAADAGHAHAQSLLAYILDLGEYNEEAYRYYKLSADQDFPDGIYGLALMTISGDGVEKDVEKGFALLRRSAALGHARSWNTLADALLNGMLAPPAEQPDAETILIRSADGGYMRAIDALTMAYSKGMLGIAPDPAKAAIWKEKAGNAKADETKE
ncbi:MAG: sel1 repeat family protein [Rhodocyclaceae bacterium]|nr:sel1 repeat family protein [Rhodocyclaceae bacterium]